MSDLLTAGFRHVAHCLERGDEWDWLYRRCESPIEETLARAFARHWSHATPARGACTEEAMRRAEREGRRLVFCQHPIGSYRADFLLFEGLRAKHEPRVPPIVVECDGHQFHQGDPETWERDAARDAAIRAAGYETLRFTGSRIASRTMEALEIIERALWGDLA
jgi:very-short-patch-repair endonuclease